MPGLFSTSRRGSDGRPAAPVLAEPRVRGAPGARADGSLPSPCGGAAGLLWFGAQGPCCLGPCATAVPGMRTSGGVEAPGHGPFTFRARRHCRAPRPAAVREGSDCVSPTLSGTVHPVHFGRSLWLILHPTAPPPPVTDAVGNLPTCGRAAGAPSCSECLSESLAHFAPQALPGERARGLPRVADPHPLPASEGVSG